MPNVCNTSTEINSKRILFENLPPLGDVMRGVYSVHPNQKNAEIFTLDQVARVSLPPNCHVLS